MGSDALNAKQTATTNPFGDSRFTSLFLAGAGVNGIRWAEIFSFSLITFELTGSPFMVVTVGLVRMVPLLFSAFIGLLAHRYPARRVIVVSVSVAAATHAAVWALAATDNLAVWHMALVAFVSGVALSADFTVRRPMLGSVVPAELLGRAMSLDFTANTVARLAGPAMSGAMLDGFGRSAIFVLGFVVYGLTLVSVLRVDFDEIPVPEGDAGRGAMTEAYGYARNSPNVMSVIVATIGMNLFVFPYRHFVPIIGTEVLGLSATRVGFLTAVEGAGMTASSLAMAMWVRSHQFVRAIEWGMALSAVGVVVFGLSTSVPLSAIAVFAVGFGVAAFANLQPAVVVAEAPPELRSRVIGLVGTLIGTNPLGLLLLGSLSLVMGAAPAVVAIGIAGFGQVLLKSGVSSRGKPAGGSQPPPSDPVDRS